jgi:PAS domain S-box-containing protein
VKPRNSGSGAGDRKPERTQAELERLRKQADGLRSAEPRAADSLRHEISVYQEELVIQNEALISAQAQLEETRDRFIELYDFAPTGYLTLDQNGVVRECNLTAAAMIGKSKAELTGITLLRLVQADYRRALVRFLRRCRSGAETRVDEMFLITTADGPRYVQFLCRLRGIQRQDQLFAAMIDVTDRRRLEHERAQLAEERAALASRLLSAQEDERREIARNLHDDVGQQVTALRLTLEPLLADPGVGDIRPRLVQVQERLAQLDASLHLISAGLRPSALDLGVAPALRQLVNDWTTASGIAASLETDDFGPGWLAPDVETQIYRILQEALTNVAKHAGASRVRVVLKRLNTAASLVVEDDGRGFNPQTVRDAKQGLGLIGIRERVQLVGGKLEVTSTPKGTTVSVTIPRSALPAMDRVR